jgi:hypothetical protein
LAFSNETNLSLVPQIPLFFQREGSSNLDSIRKKRILPFSPRNKKSKIKLEMNPIRQRYFNLFTATTNTFQCFWKSKKESFYFCLFPAFAFCQGEEKEKGFLFSLLA